MKTFYKIIYFVLFSIIIFTSGLITTPKLLRAQSPAISLSVNPPLVEVLAKPGKSFEERYLIRNDGAPTSVKVNIAPFSSGDSLGNVNLGENLSDFDPQSFASWFAFTKPRMKYGGRLYISTGETREVILKISIPEDADNGDYYFTITFETDYGDEIIAGNLKSKAKIGSNILITVSGDDLPSKKAKIISFEAPKIVDGFSPITYGVTIENIGSTLFKPEGKIVIKNILGRAEVLTLAPQNILASSKRNIYCLDGEKLISCTLNIKNKLPFGIYRATLIFNPDGEDQTYEEEAVTLVLPATYIAVIFILIIILKKIFRKTSNVK